MNSSERHVVDGGRGDARRRRRVCSVAARERARGGEELGERVRGLGGCVASRTGSRATRGSRRWPGGSRRWPRPLGRAPRLASVRPPGRGGRGQGGGGGLGRPDGAGPGKWRQVSGPGGFLLCFIFFFCFVLFNLFCHCFEFKIIQTMPKTPLKIFRLLNGLFQKHIKMFQGIWKYILYKL